MMYMRSSVTIADSQGRSQIAEDPAKSSCFGHEPDVAETLYPCRMDRSMRMWLLFRKPLFLFSLLLLLGSCGTLEKASQHGF
jgi:hypothetical protein